MPITNSTLDVYFPPTPIPDNNTYQICYFDSSTCADYVCNIQHASITYLPVYRAWTCNVSSDDTAYEDFQEARHSNLSECEGTMGCTKAKEESGGQGRVWLPVKLVVGVMCLSLIVGHLA
ncbi:hypothetical protein IAT38_006031 [Cryptococcus sp. DSM 104549]